MPDTLKNTLHWLGYGTGTRLGLGLSDDSHMMPPEWVSPKTVSIIEMDKRTNTYLLSGPQLPGRASRIYLPGNAVDYDDRHDNAFPDGTDQKETIPDFRRWQMEVLRWEGLQPLP